ncbi:TIGR01777 family oxidoreductase [Marinicrinis sediminis]|uniref:TIGR01777 family oxidoreductase n=1 Tax=Marinicrinis sediminis TaxID=1652465 RepID=A0ABW5REG3_9BACL
MRILIGGASGFIGQRLMARCKQEGYQVTTLTRGPTRQASYGLAAVNWDELLTHQEQLEGVDVIVNLAGETISQRWTEDAKERILQSRLETTHAIARLVAGMTHKPKAVINSSGMNVYGTSLSKKFDETSTDRGDDFLAEVVQKWEEAVDTIEVERRVKLRTGLVLGREGGALPKMVLPYRLFVGGRIGSGRQWHSWIHIEDMVRIILFAIVHADLEGPVNCTTPKPVTNDQFGRTIAGVLHRPHFLPAPAAAFKLMFGEMSQLLLEGQYVYSSKLKLHGFDFQYPDLKSALTDLLGR